MKHPDLCEFVFCSKRWTKLAMGTGDSVNPETKEWGIKYCDEHFAVYKKIRDREFRAFKVIDRATL